MLHLAFIANLERSLKIALEVAFDRLSRMAAFYGLPLDPILRLSSGKQFVKVLNKATS